MATIRSIADMGNTAELSDLCHEIQGPVYITKNGREDLVVMSVEAYEREQVQLDLYRKLAVAEQQAVDGVKPLEGHEVFGTLRAKYGY